MADVNPDLPPIYVDAVGESAPIEVTDPDVPPSGMVRVPGLGYVHRGVFVVGSLVLGWFLWRRFRGAR